MRDTFTHDVIIIGQGLAGAVLSETLVRRGLRVMMFDAPRDGRASWVASGIVNPIVLRRTVLSWRASEMLAVAGAFYRELELLYDTTFWHPLPLVELFPTAQEAGIWQLRMKDPELARFLGRGPLNDAALAGLPQPYGYGVVKRSAWLDVKTFLRAHRERWLSAGGLEERTVRTEDVVRREDAIEVYQRSAPLLISCTGPFADVPGLSLVRGEGIKVRIPGFLSQAMLHRGVFALPLGNELFYVGSTFAWDDVWSGPTAEGQRALLDRLSRLVKGPVEVLEHWAGVRPAAKDRRPILGRTAPHEAMMNGLGSRGVLLSPWCAQHLAEHLLDGSP
ncbi:MAG TPA: FAD-dependent oxidoreductase, partial [Flavobacteriales bacterium]|nr:FAD-dependent oxidoreductase [Flavobacteriales bacterium]